MRKKSVSFSKNMIGIFIVLFVLFTLIGILSGDFSFPVSGDTDKYISPSIYMMKRETEDSVYEKNADKKMYPASLTKIMTALVAIEEKKDLSALAPIDVETYQKMIEKGSSMAGFVGREQVTYRDLLYGTILNSGGEAANSLAVHVAGNVEHFVKMMNKKAETLGLTRTHFTNPEGLHDQNQYTTARDMAKLLHAALNDEQFRAVFTKETFLTSETIDHPEGILLESTVLSQLRDETQEGFDIIGGKSGTTYAAGQCWATLGTIEDEEYICIVMGAPLEDISHPDRAQKKDTLNLFKQMRSNRSLKFAASSTFPH